MVSFCMQQRKVQDSDRSTIILWGCFNGALDKGRWNPNLVILIQGLHPQGWKLFQFPCPVSNVVLVFMDNGGHIPHGIIGVISIGSNNIDNFSWRSGQFIPQEARMGKFLASTRRGKLDGSGRDLDFSGCSIKLVGGNANTELSTMPPNDVVGAK